MIRLVFVLLKVPKSQSDNYTYLDRCFQLQQDWLGDEDFTSLGAKITNLCLQKLYLFAWSAASDLQQSVDDGIEIYIVLVRHSFSPLVGR